MSDPLSDTVRLLRPRAVFAKGISAAGAWAVRYSRFGEPSFCVVLHGNCVLHVDGHAPVSLQAGDFVLLPATPGFLMHDGKTQLASEIDPQREPAPEAEVRHGRADGPPDVRLLGGWFRFDAPDPALVATLLPSLLHVRGVPRLSLLVQLLGEEADASYPGREIALARLADLLLVESLRATSADSAPAGLLRGLADARIAPALHGLHARPAHPWTSEQLARAASLSRSAFFDRFTRTVGIAPMEYLLGWRMALAKDLLRHEHLGIHEVAERVGYASAAAFSTAFSRHVGMPPSRFPPPAE